MPPPSPLDLPLHPFVRTIARALRRRCAVGAGARLVVAVSGGADSVALLRALHAVAPRRGWGLALTVAHVQHHLRGEAEADAAFVAELAASLGLPHLRRDVHPAAAGGNVELAARRLRYEALRDMAAEARAAFVATAHHGDDQLETLLMRVLRGSSVGGLRGIAWRRRLGEGATLVRPMLGATAGDARRFLATIGQPWCEDHTNADASRWRARLRRDVLPVLRELRPDAAAKAVALGDHARAVRRLLAAETRAAHARLVTGGQLQREAAAGLQPAVLVGVVRRMLRDAGARRDRLRGRAVVPLLRALRDPRGGRREWRFGGGVVAVLDRRALRVERAASPIPVNCIAPSAGARAMLLHAEPSRPPWSPSMPKPISLQMYTVRELTKTPDDYRAVIRRLADIGYAAIEGGPPSDMDAKAFKAFLADLGMHVSSSWAKPTKDNVNQLVDTAMELGFTCYVNCVGVEQFKTDDQVRKTAEAFEEMAQVLRPHGLNMLYHNHWWEFEYPTRGGAGWDRLMALAPSCGAELDCYWASNFGAVDVPAVVKRYAARTPLLHVKDGPLVKDEPNTAVGSGQLDVAACVAAADPAVLQYVIVELDRSGRDVMDDVRDSYEYLVRRGIGRGHKG